MSSNIDDSLWDSSSNDEQSNVWNCLTQRLRYFDLSNVTGSHRVVKAAMTILDSITHDEIYRFYKKSGVFNLHGHKK